MGGFHGIVVNMLEVSYKKASSNSGHTIKLTFGLIPLGKVWIPLSLHLWIK